MNDDLGRRLARLREEWPVGSMADVVRARIEAESPMRRRRRGRWLAGAAASAAGLLGVLTLAWILVASRPTTLLASVRRDVERAGSARLIVLARGEGGKELRSDTWYVKGLGVRVEEPGRVMVEDAASQWSWRTDAGDPVVIRQGAPGFFANQLRAMAAPEGLDEEGWRRERSPDLDRDVDGRACRGYTFAAPAERLPGRPPMRALVLVDDRERVREIAFEERRGDGTWRRPREMHIEYDPPILPDELAFRPPAGAKVVDRDEAFRGLYPLDRALHRVEMGGLILAVHDVQPLEGREGVYVVSSVRGTPEFLAQHPPRRRHLNPEWVALDVAFQRMTNGMYGGAYDVVGLAEATREGVEYAWWVVFPRRFYTVKDGRREYFPEPTQPALPGEPVRLDDLPGKLRVPLHACHWNESIRDREVSTWVEVPLPADRPPATVEAVAARARRDLLQMGGGVAGYRLMGIAAGVPSDPSLRPVSSFAPESIADADFAAAVRRGMDDLRKFDDLTGATTLGGPSGDAPRP